MDSFNLGVSLNIDLVRKQIPVTSRRAYFDNAGTGPPSIPVLTAINEFMADWREYRENWEEWLPLIIESRRQFGKMIGGVPLDEIPSVPNLTTPRIRPPSSVNHT